MDLSESDFPMALYESQLADGRLFAGWDLSSSWHGKQFAAGDLGRMAGAIRDDRERTEMV